MLGAVGILGAGWPAVALSDQRIDDEGSKAAGGLHSTVFTLRCQMVETWL